NNESVNFWSYINSLTLNGSVIITVFGVSEDIVALDAYRQAMPNYKIIGINFSKYPVGSVHCQTKEMFK
ncbi:agmatine deiminase family protein, partial [Flavobacterium sp.]|uniref:agmatine deiminase family protein n=1 Tax=Flavobacterium sp. TaxID=239 RepID=UPI0033409BA3